MAHTNHNNKKTDPDLTQGHIHKKNLEEDQRIIWVVVDHLYSVWVLSVCMCGVCVCVCMCVWVCACVCVCVCACACVCVCKWPSMCEINYLQVWHYKDYVSIMQSMWQFPQHTHTHWPRSRTLLSIVQLVRSNMMRNWWTLVTPDQLLYPHHLLSDPYTPEKYVKIEIKRTLNVNTLGTTVHSNYQHVLY